MISQYVCANLTIYPPPFSWIFKTIPNPLTIIIHSKVDEWDLQLS